jgi:cyclophilin family peptidyl-prolyl cis-trans isomerase
VEPLLDDPDAGESAAWALGRMPGGAKSLAACLERSCPSAAAAARALAGPAAAKEPMVDALAAALRGGPHPAAAGEKNNFFSAAAEAGFALGVLARNKDAPVARAREALAAALGSADPAVRTGAAYAFSRMPKGDPVPLEALLRDGDAWTRSLAARAWGKQGMDAGGLSASLQDEDWRVRVEAARGLATAASGASILGAALREAIQELPKGARFAHTLVALFESAAQMGELALSAIPEPASISAPTRAATAAVRCGAAIARDRLRKQLADTPGCGAGLEPEWRTRLRAGALAAELAQERPELVAKARESLHDSDARVRGAAAGAAGSALADDLRQLLSDPDPYVIQEAASSLAKENAAASLDAALAAVQRLSAAHTRPAGDPRSDALGALVDLIAAAQPRETPPAVLQLLPAPSVVLHGAIGKMYKMSGPPPAPVVPAEARQEPRAHVLRLRTSAGDLTIALRPDVAPLTSSALAALTRRGFYDGLTFHRVVPDFVVQGGDPRGDGDGGPGWALPDEHSPMRFLRGTLGIATSGPETGGSQFFLCHSPQPHLDGRYTITGELREGADVMDALQPGDTILSAAAE